MGGQSDSTVRRRKEDQKTRASFNKVITRVINVHAQMEEIESELKSKDFPVNHNTGMLVDMLVEAKDNTSAIQKKAVNKSFVYNNIELFTNQTLKKVFKEDPGSEAIMIDRKTKCGNTGKKKKRSRRSSENNGSRGRRSRKVS
jgi:hypothetical protein